MQPDTITKLAEAIAKVHDAGIGTTVVAVIGLVFSAGSVTIALTTAWYTLWKKGRVDMTRPLMIAFVGSEGPKVVMRATLFSTAKRGNVIESMHVRVRREQNKQTLNVWGFGNSSQEYGGGLFVGPEGAAHYHHFLPPKDGTGFCFLPGELTLEVFTKTLGEDSEVCIFTQTFELTPEQAEAANGASSSTIFHWGPDTGKYYPHIDRRGSELLETNPREPDPSPELLSVELLPSKQLSLILDRNSIGRITYMIGIKNWGPFAITPRSLRVTLTAIGDGGFNHTLPDVEVHEQFRELIAFGGEQPAIAYPVATPKYDGKPPPSVRMNMKGHIMVASPAWEGVKKLNVDSFAWGAVADQRFIP